MAFKDLTKITLIVALLAICCNATTDHNSTVVLNRGSFPPGFIFGAGSSSYQYEGAASEGGKGPSIWDTYTHKHPERIADGSNGDVAVDFYHRYKGDVQLMKEMGIDAFRFSIAWPRIIPSGKQSDGVNQQGIDFYNNLINEILANGLKPYVTLFHWDVPQALEDEYGGFLSPKIVDDYLDFINICFKEFGDRVKHWFTLNEPRTFSFGGYTNGMLAPGRCSSWTQLNCSGGDSGTEPYLVSHNLLLAHASGIKLYRDKYQKYQNGKIGITLESQWAVPFSKTKLDLEAAFRSIDFEFGWFMDPITNGDYPHSMRLLVGDRLPKFTKEQSKMLKGSFDFLGLNYYTTNYASYAPDQSNNVNISYLTDSQVNLTTSRDGKLIGSPAASSWLFVYPKGIWDMILYIKKKYNNPVMYITENGMDDPNNATLPLEQALDDTKRIAFYSSHLFYVKKAIEDGANVKGFFAWSLFDDFEWNSGYTIRFGLYFVDFKNGLKRYPKHSALWFKKFLE
ncbi:beta-glucosidase 12-like [Impatiens glandulifera]|uniref:beta-glucosidase 12-like n=1 Tax=Impatiens glandulifera TaxID=253017 RepID=UPI001FB132F1|nr:beta-glucosidase 12-like [Impatiens glandulifera]